MAEPIRCMHWMPLHAGCRLDCSLAAGHDGMHRDSGYPVAWRDVADVEVGGQSNG